MNLLSDPFHFFPPKYLPLSQLGSSLSKTKTSISDERRQFKHLNAAFRAFLVEASGFYISFLKRLTTKFHLEHVQKVAAEILELEDDVEWGNTT